MTQITAEAISVLICLQIKPKFDGSLPSYPLKFGTPMDNDQKFGIVKGTLSLQSQEITKAYSIVERRIVEGCSNMMKGRNVKVTELVRSLPP
jgi:hypothetical protein